MATPEFPPLVAIPRLNLRQDAANQLRAQVTAGALEPGVFYSIGAVAAQLQVSATPVREAVLELAQEGLLEVSKNRGFQVRVPTDKELDDLLDLRVVLEVPAMGRLAGQRPAPDLADLRPVADHLVQLAESGDMVEFVAVDKDFHLALTARLGNEQYVGMVEQLRNRTRLLGLPHLVGDTGLVSSAREHVQLLDLVEAGDVTGTEDLMRRHLGHVRGLWAGRPEGTTA